MEEWESKVACLSWNYFFVSHALFSRPQNYQELFNLRHSSARNTVERIFGIFKREFGLFKTAPEYPIDMQAMFVPALSAIHNFNRVHDRSTNHIFDENISTGFQGATSNTQTEPRIVTEQELGFNITAEERQRANERRDRIAKAMWADYQAELRQRGE